MVYDCCRHVGQINTIDPLQEGEQSAVLASHAMDPGQIKCFPALAALPNYGLIAGDMDGCLHFFEVDGAAIRPSGTLEARMCGPCVSLPTVPGSQ